MLAVPSPKLGAVDGRRRCDESISERQAVAPVIFPQIVPGFATSILIDGNDQECTEETIEEARDRSNVRRATAPRR